MEKDRFVSLVFKAVVQNFSGNHLIKGLDVQTRMATETVLDFFSDLKSSLLFDEDVVVLGNYKKTQHPEWLFDLAWIKQSPSRSDGCALLKSVLLALESEWKFFEKVLDNARVDDDFKKLVQSRAWVRVWVSQSATDALAVRHIANCIEQSLAFDARLDGDCYIVMLNVWSEPRTVVIGWSVQGDDIVFLENELDKDVIERVMEQRRL